MQKRYSKKFKNYVLNYVEQHPDITIENCSENLDISAQELRNWINEKEKKK